MKFPRLVKTMEEDRNLQQDLFYGVGELDGAVAEDTKFDGSSHHC